MNPASSSEAVASIITNLGTYLEIAEESLAKSRRIEGAQTRPMLDGSPGKIFTWDPARASFKHSLIAIVFAGIYLEALVSVTIKRRRLNGPNPSVKPGNRGKRRDRDKGRYEADLAKLDIADDETIEGCRRLEDARDTVVHEQPMIVRDGETGKIHIAQREAEHAVSFVRRLAKRLMSEGPTSTSAASRS